MVFFRSLLFSIVLSVASLSIQANEILNADIAAADSVVDAILEQMRYDPGMKERLDPLKLATFGEGSYEVSEGNLFGLLGFVRSGNSSLLYLSDGETVVVSTPITVSQVFLYGRHSYSKSFVKIRGDIEAKTDEIEARSIIRMPYAGGTSSKLESLMVTHTKGMTITKITGMSAAFNWLLKIVANRVLKQFKEKIESTFEREITPKFEDFVDGRTTPPFQGRAELTETPFEGQLATESYASYGQHGFLG